MPLPACQRQLPALHHCLGISCIRHSASASNNQFLGAQVTVAQVQTGPHGTTLQRQPGSGAAADASYLYSFVQSRALEAAEGGHYLLGADARLGCITAAQLKNSRAKHMRCRCSWGMRRRLDIIRGLGVARHYTIVCNCHGGPGRGQACLQLRVVAHWPHIVNSPRMYLPVGTRAAYGSAAAERQPARCCRWRTGLAHGLFRYT